ncbi:alpha/beta fold hydrolase [Streptomyces sp. NPDC008163]|uniref:alpha/beta fold hydrolase n=1 Tax=Streptomyces sp. NPDC008163 TaxID=3364818 RepID=UPI0036EC70CF
MSFPDHPNGAADVASLVLVGGDRPVRRARAAVLLLHGGRADALEPPAALNLPALRMKPFARSIQRAVAQEDVLVGNVRYLHRGWNGHHAHPVADARRALSELYEIAGLVPVVLVGHSMGARAALRAAADPQVRGVIALAPWCPPDEPASHVGGRTVIALHDESDRITRATDTWAYLSRAQAAGAHAYGLRMAHGGHTMIRHARQWQRLATEAATGVLGLTPLPSPLAEGGTWSGEPVPAAGRPPRR